MKNLLYIGNALSQKGKTSTTIDTLSKSLQKEGFNVYVVSRKTNKLYRLFDMLFSIMSYRKHVDYVIIDTYSTLNFYYAFLCSQLCRMLKLKYIPILHGGDLPKRLEKSPKFSKTIFSNAYVNVAPSLYLKSYFQDKGYNNIKYIPNTIELKKYKYQERAYKQIKLLWVRSFSKLYNPTLAVKLLKSLREQGQQASLCMIGPDNDGSLIETKQLAKKLNLNVEFTGKLTKEQWHEKSQEFNVFINTTNVDNTPVSVIEAMALGLPVISTNVGGMPFLINNEVDGILVEPNNIEAFKNSILNLIRNKKATDQIAANARKKVEEFDWDIIKHKWFSILS